MRANRLTAVDVCAVSGYTRNQLRAVLDELPPYADQKLPPRVAREFSRLDLYVLSIVHALDVEFNIRRPAIAEVIDQLHSTLAGPKPSAQHTSLLISLKPPFVKFARLQDKTSNGILVEFKYKFNLVDRYIAGEEI